MKIEINGKVIETRLDLSVAPKNRKASIIAQFDIRFAQRFNVFGLCTPHGKLRFSLKWKCDSKDKIIVEKGRDLLTMECKNSSGNDFIVDINGEPKVELRLFFDHGAVKDCENRGIDNFKISYTVECTPDASLSCCLNRWFGKPNEMVKKSKIIDETVTIGLEPIQVEPKLSPPVKPFEYKAGHVTAELQISNSSTLHYAPTVCVRINPNEVYLYQQPPKGQPIIINDAVKVKAEDVKSSIKYAPGDVRFELENQKSEIMNKNYEIETIYPHSGYHIILPLEIDLNQIPNPEGNSDTYYVNVGYDYWSSKDDKKDQNKNHKAEPIEIVVNKNKEKVGLGVYLLSKGTEVPRVVNDATKVGQHVVLNLKGTTSYRIAIKNTATVVQKEHPDAGVVIRNFTCSGISLKNGVIALDESNHNVGIDSVCQCAPNNETELRRLRPNESKDIDILFNTKHSTIHHFLTSDHKKVFKAEAEVKVSFDYYIDEVGEDNPNAEFKHFSGSVAFVLEQAPRREWLGVDFGTSAVVALYGNTTTDDGSVQPRDKYIQDLQKIKKTGLAKAYRTASKEYRDVTDENIFINSKIVLGANYPHGEDIVKNFDEYPKGRIQFSPGDQFDYSKLLPSLKSMMGYESVPRKEKVTVDEVYELAYRQLFNLYLNRLTSEAPVEKMVMTYPNTFSTEHVKRLKKFARECLGDDLREDYIVTVSESDAVAYQYLKRRYDPDDDFMAHTGEDVDRNVLIYDMGAGTLDITYFGKVVENGVRKVEIKGKFGLNKAGNYLDYVLASIVVNICKKHGITDVNGNSFEGYILLDNTAPDIETRYTLKNYVKDKLKPIMADIEDVNNIGEAKMPQWENKADGLKDIPLAEVFRRKEFVKFIEDVSTNVVNCCDRIFPGGLSEVDVVVFSGRMTTMKAIRNAVMKAISEKVQKIGKDKVVIDKDIAEGEGGQELQVRKTAVVDGALTYVENFIGGKGVVLLPPKPFFARYCIVAKGAFKTEVILKLTNTDCDMNKEYIKSRTIDLSEYNMIHLIQTYAADDTAILEDFKGDRNLTTVLGSLETRHLPLNPKLAIKYQADPNRNDQGTKAISWAVGDIEQEMLPHENIKSEAFRKSAWPVVF